MAGDAFVVVFLKPEIATGYFKFAASSARAPEGGATPPAAQSSSIPGVSAVEAAFLLPNGHILPAVLTRIKDAGFEIVQRRMKQLNRAEARHLFSSEQQRRFGDDEQTFAAFLAAVTSGPSLALVLKLPASIAAGDANAAIKKWKELAGDWDPVAARKKALAASIPHDQWPLRALCGLNAVRNGISSSSHLCCVRRERFFLFPSAAPPLERATIVLLPSFHANFPDGKDVLLSTIGKEVRAIVVDSKEGCPLSGDEALALCGLTRTFNEGPIHQAYESVVEAAEQAVTGKGVDVLVLEGVDLSFTLRAAVGPANLELARLYFPESVRGQVPFKLPTVELPAGLHPNETADEDGLGFESGLFLSFDAKLSIGGDAGAPQNGDPVECTLGLIKPNAACKPDVVAEILRMINVFGFTVERQRRLLLSRDQAGAFYAEHRGKPFFETLVGFMTSGEIVALHLSRTHAVKAWRGLMGPTNSIRARETHPWTLRARFGVDGTRNATHGSDSSASAARELGFFFGSAVTASSTAAKVTSARAVAQRPMVLSGSAESSVEKVLTQGLKELMEKNLSDPLAACRWLGEWLVTYRARGLDEEPADSQPLTRSGKLVAGVKRNPEVGKRLTARKVVAISLDKAINEDLRTAVLTVLLERLRDARYEVIDIAAEMKKHTAMDVGIANITATLKECGRRRCVLFDCEKLSQSSAFHREFKAQAPVEWQINFVVHMELESSNEGALPPSASFGIPVLPVALPSSVSCNCSELRRKDGALQGLFSAVFDPSIMLVADAKKLVPVSLWNEVAKQFGFHLLTFDGVVTKVKSSHDDSDDTRLFLELLRSGSSLPPTLVLAILRRVILAGDGSLAQKFLLMGFPWSEMQASELEEAIGRPQSVLLVGEGGEANSSTVDLPGWVVAFRKKGLVKRVWIDSSSSADRGAVCSALNGALAPVVGCFLGRSNDDKQLQEVQAVAKSHEFIWVDCTTSSSLPVQELRELLLRVHAGREKLLLYGYPQTPAQASELLRVVGAPQFVLHDSAAASSAVQDLVAVFDAQPAIVQLDLARSANAQTPTGSSKLRSTFFCKQVVALVGSVDTLNLRQLRDVVAPLGYDVIDLIGGLQGDEPDQVRELERRVRAVQAPRCLVVGSPESSSLFHALEARIGCAMHKVLILQQVPVRARAANAMDDADSEDYSDEEQSSLFVEDNGSDNEDNPLPPRSGIKWRKVMRALSPQRSQLLQSLVSSPNSSISVDVVGYLEPGSARVVQDVVARLRPRLVAVIGHPFSFYQTAARSFCRRHLAAFVNLTSSLQAIETLAAVVATTPHALYCLDGFPRSSNADDVAGPSASQPRYVAQQLWELERRLGSLDTLVHFTTALEVLDERTPEHVTRRMLDVAQDELELASGELVSWFATGKSRRRTTTEVTCDRTLEDAQEELDGVLHKTLLRPSRPVLKQKSG